MKVIIIGGGIGGLALAQGLKKSGVEVSVYERDESAHFRKQGYRIGINTQGGRALHSCLPKNLFDLFFATSIRPIDGKLATYDPQLNEIFSIPLPQSVNDINVLLNGTTMEGFTGVNRFTLREIMLYGLEDIVHFGKIFERYEQNDVGVTAYFTDGTSAVGDLLIGADGTGSAVRKEYLPHAKVQDVGFAIYGKTPLIPEVVKSIPENFVEGMPRVADKTGVSFACGSFRKRKDFTQAVARYAPGTRLTDVSDYLMWIFHAPLARLGMTNETLWGTDAASLHAAILPLVEQWHPTLKLILEKADIAATFAVRLRSAEKVENWMTTNVTLLGDAIHTMTPGRGMGANVALRDAAHLCNQIVSAVEGRSTLLSALTRYETDMRTYGFGAVADSLERPFCLKDH